MKVYIFTLFRRHPEQDSTRTLWMTVSSTTGKLVATTSSSSAKVRRGEEMRKRDIRGSLILAAWQRTKDNETVCESKLLSDKIQSV